MNKQSRALITERCAPKSQNFFDYRTHKTGKMLPHVKYSSERSNFSDFFATFTASVGFDTYFDLQHQDR